MDAYNNFKDAGVMEPDYRSEPTADVNRAKEMKMRHERITIDADEFPYLQKLKVGSKCELRVQIRKTGEKMAENYENDKENKITFEILKIAEPKSSKSDYDELIKEGNERLKDEK